MASITSTEVRGSPKPELCTVSGAPPRFPVTQLLGFDLSSLTTRAAKVGVHFHQPPTVTSGPEGLQGATPLIFFHPFTVSQLYGFNFFPWLWHQIRLGENKRFPLFMGVRLWSVASCTWVSNAQGNPRLHKTHHELWPPSGEGAPRNPPSFRAVSVTSLQPLL